MKKLISILIIITTFMFNIDVFAQTQEMKIDINSNNVTVSGVLSTKKNNRLISVFMLDKDNSVLNIGIENSMHYIGATKMDYDGNFSFSFEKPQQSNQKIYLKGDGFCVVKGIEDNKDISFVAKMDTSFNKHDNKIYIDINMGAQYREKLFSVFMLDEGSSAFDFDNAVVSCVNAGNLDLNGKATYSFEFLGEKKNYTMYVVCDDLAMGQEINIEKITIVDFDPLKDSFGLTDIYPEIKGLTTKERFFERVAEIPDEMPVVMPQEIRQGKYVFYVDEKNGDDLNTGTFEKPFETLQKALQEAAKLDYTSKKDGVNIYLRGGLYSLKYPIQMLSYHSGTDEFPLYISAYNDEDVIFEVGYRIAGNQFTDVKDEKMRSRLNPLVRDEIKTVDLKELGITDYGTLIDNWNPYDQPVLYCGEQTMSLARYPNTGTVSVGKVINPGKADSSNNNPSGVSFTFLDERPLMWENTGDIAIFGGIGREWNPVRIYIHDIDKENHVLISNDNPGDGVVASDDPAYAWAAPTSYYYYNVFEELDMPGEWYLDRNEGKLYVYPSGDINNQTYTYCVGQKEPFNLSNVKNVVLNKIHIRNGSYRGITLKNCENVVLQNCTIENFACEGVVMGGCKKTGLTSCKIYNISKTGISICENNYEYANLIPCRNFVQNCYIARQDNDEQTGGIAMSNTVGNIISHNLVQNFDAYAIAPGGCENIVEYNEIVGSPRVVNDMAPIYWSGMLARGTHVRYNYIHNPAIKAKAGRGIYFDELGSDCYAYGNIIDGYVSGVYTHGGQNIVCYNNVIMNSPSGTGKLFSDSINFYNRQNNVWNRNIFSTTGGGLYEYLVTGLVNPKDVPWKTRYPDLYDYVRRLDQYFADMNTEGYAWDGNYLDANGNVQNEASLRAPSGHYVANNISYKNGGLSMTSIGMQTACEISPNLVTEENPGFTDIENKNYTMLPTQEVKDALPDFIAPPFEKMGLISANTHWSEERSNSLHCVYPKEGAKTTNENITFDWSIVPFASYYVMTLAYDANFNNIVGSYKVKDSRLEVSVPETGRTYYWKVDAYSDVKMFNGNVISSGVSSFSSMTFDEMKALLNGYRGEGIIYASDFSNDINEWIKDSSVCEVSNGKLNINSSKESNIIPPEFRLMSLGERVKASFDLDFSNAADTSSIKTALKADESGRGYFVEFYKTGIDRTKAVVNIYKNSEIIYTGQYNTCETYKYRVTAAASNTDGRVNIDFYIANIYENGETGETKLIARAVDNSEPILKGGFMLVTKQGAQAQIDNLIIWGDSFEEIGLKDILCTDNKVSFKVYNNSDSDISPVIYVVVYNKQDILEKIYIKKDIMVKSLGVSDEIDFNTDFELMNERYIKVLIWDTNLKPFTKAHTLSN